MKTQFIYTILFLILFTAPILAQEEENSDNDGITLDLLSAPEVPAASLLGIAGADIIKPGSPSEILTSLRENSNNFTQLPSSYAIDIHPFLLFSKKRDASEIKDSLSEDWKERIGLSFALDMQSPTEDVPFTTKFGVGLKLSLVKGKLNEELVSDIDTLLALKNKAKKFRDALVGKSPITILNNDPTYKQLSKDLEKLYEQGLEGTSEYKSINDSLELLEQEILNFDTLSLSDKISKTKIEEEKLKEKKEKIEKNDTKQYYGFKLDLHTGISSIFSDSYTVDERLDKFGLWLTSSYEHKKGYSALGIARILHSPNKILVGDDFSNIGQLTTIDVGGRLLYESPKKGFGFSGEIIYRWIPDNDEIANSIKYFINLDYKVKNNTIISLGFGRNFNGEFVKSGNLTGVVSLFAGFGNKRNLK